MDFALDLLSNVPRRCSMMRTSSQNPQLRRYHMSAFVLPLVCEGRK